MSAAPVSAAAPAVPLPESDENQGYLGKLLDKLPFIKNLKEETKKTVKKVISVAIWVLACAALGAAAGFILSLAFSPLFIGVGAALGGITYLAIWGVKEVIKKYGYPAYSYKKAEPIRSDHWLSDEHHEKFQTLVKDLKTKSWFAAWQQLQGLKDDEIEQHLWKAIQRGSHYGEAQSLVELTSKKGDQSCSDMLGAIKPKSFFKNQLAEIFRSDLANGGKLGDLQELEKEHKLVNPTCPEIKIPFSILENEKAFEEKLKECFPDNDKPIAATLRLQNSTQSQVLFLQFSPKFRFYDNYSYRFTGFHETATQDEFIKALQQHLIGYTSRTRPGTPRFTEAILLAYRSASDDKMLEEANSPQFKQALEEVKETTWFTNWKQSKPDVVDAEAYLWGLVRKGTHFAKVQVLVEQLLLNEEKPSQNLIDETDPKMIFKYQLKEIISEELSQDNKIENLEMQEEILHFKNIDDATTFKKEFTKCFPDPNARYAATIQLQEGTQKHLLFLQHGLNYCFYDSSSNEFHKQKNLSQLVESLRLYLKKLASEKSYTAAKIRVYYPPAAEVLKKFLEEVKAIQDNPWYKTWQKWMGFSDEESTQNLRVRIQKGSELAQMRVFVERCFSGEKLDAKIDPQTVFRNQLRTIIHSDLKHKGEKVNLPEIDQGSKMKECDSIAIDFAILDKIDEFKAKIKECLPDQDKPLAATLNLQNAQNQSHALFLQFSPFRFYDNTTVAHEFANLEDFTDSLRLHLKKYADGTVPKKPKFDKALIQGYRK